MPRKKSNSPSPDAGNGIKEIATVAKIEAILAEAVAAEAEKAKNFADDGDIVARTDLLVTITNSKKYEAFQKNIESAMILITDYEFVGNGKVLLRVEMR